MDMYIWFMILETISSERSLDQRGHEIWEIIRSESSTDLREKEKKDIINLRDAFMTKSVKSNKSVIIRFW